MVRPSLADHSEAAGGVRAVGAELARAPACTPRIEAGWRCEREVGAVDGGRYEAARAFDHAALCSFFAAW